MRHLEAEVDKGVEGAGGQGEEADPQQEQQDSHPGCGEPGLVAQGSFQSGTKRQAEGQGGEQSRPVLPEQIQTIPPIGGGHGAEPEQIREILSQLRQGGAVKNDPACQNQNQGVQVTTGTTGANATSPISFSNISKIDVKYCTNAKSGEGTIKLQVGTGTAKTFSVTAPSSGGTDLKTATFDYSTAETGYVKLTVDCTTNSIYISSVAITYSNIPHTVTFDAGTGTCESTSLNGATITLPYATACENSGWEFVGWSTTVVSETTTAPTLLAGGSSYSPSSDLTLYAVYAYAQGDGGITFNVANYASANNWYNGTQ